MRVIAGSAKGRRLVAPRGDTTRPTSDFVREAIFNSLQSVVDFDGAAVIDLFAGTGALGIEALSRGAETCIFIENDRRAVEAIRANLEATGLPGGTVVHAPVPGWLGRPTAVSGAPSENRFAVAFADPPYSFDDWASVAVVDASVLVAESDREIDLAPPWAILRSRRYGSTVVTLFVRQESS